MLSVGPTEFSLILLFILVIIFVYFSNIDNKHKILIQNIISISIFLLGLNEINRENLQNQLILVMDLTLLWLLLTINLNKSLFDYRSLARGLPQTRLGRIILKSYLFVLIMVALWVFCIITDYLKDIILKFIPIFPEDLFSTMILLIFLTLFWTALGFLDVHGFLKRAFNDISSTLGQIWSLFFFGARNIWIAISRAAARIWSGITYLVRGIWSIVFCAKDRIWSLIIFLTRSISTAVSRAAARIWSGITYLVKGIWNAISFAARRTHLLIKNLLSTWLGKAILASYLLFFSIMFFWLICLVTGYLVDTISRNLPLPKSPFSTIVILILFTFLWIILGFFEELGIPKRILFNIYSIMHMSGSVTIFLARRIWHAISYSLGRIWFSIISLVRSIWSIASLAKAMIVSLITSIIRRIWSVTSIAFGQFWFKSTLLAKKILSSNKFKLTIIYIFFSMMLFYVLSYIYIYGHFNFISQEEIFVWMIVLFILLFIIVRIFSKMLKLGDRILKLALILAGHETISSLFRLVATAISKYPITSILTPIINLFTIPYIWNMDLPLVSGNLEVTLKIVIIFIIAYISVFLGIELEDRISVRAPQISDWSKLFCLFILIIILQSIHVSHQYVEAADIHYVYGYDNETSENPDKITAIKHYDSSLSLSERAMIYNPFNLKAFELKGNVLRQFGGLKNNTKFYNESLYFYGFATLNPWCASGFNGKGIDYYYLNETEKAILEYDKAIECNPNFEYALFNKALALYKCGNSTEATIYFNKSKHLFYSEADNYRVESLTALNESDYHKSLDFCNKSIRFYLICKQACLLKSLCNQHEGIQDMRECLEIDEQLAAALQNRGLILNAIRPPSYSPSPARMT